MGPVIDQYIHKSVSFKVPTMCLAVCRAHMIGVLKEFAVWLEKTKYMELLGNTQLILFICGSYVL